MAVKTCISWCELKRISKRPGAKHSGNRATLRSPPRIPVTSTPTYNCVPSADPAPKRMRRVSIRQHASAYVSKRQHTSAYLRPSGCRARECPAALLIPQHTYSVRQYTSANVSIRQPAPKRMRSERMPRRIAHTSAYVQHASVHVSIRQHTSAYVNLRPSGCGARENPAAFAERSKCTDYCTAVCVPLY